MKTMDNLKEFKALIKKYKSITIKDIEDVRDDFGELYSSEGLASALTGFGRHKTCTLCKPLLDEVDRVNCSGCVWLIKTSSTCTIKPNRKTYDKIEQAFSDEKILEAFKARAEYMKTVLKIKT